MKELSIEEKAKAYDEALRVLHKYDGVNILFSQSLKEEMFPELAESRDERVKKAIITLLNTTIKGKKLYSITDTTRSEMIAWLEKQGKDNKEEYSVWVGGVEINDYYLSKEEAEKLAEEYKKDGYDDVIVEKQENGNFDNFKDSQREQVAESKESLNDKSEELSQEEVTKTSEQEWSEKDDSHIHNIIGYLGECKAYNPTSKNKDIADKEIRWLKSLRHQSHWRPSDEMLEALYRVIPENTMEISEDEMLLDKLYQGLKYGKVLSEK